MPNNGNEQLFTEGEFLGINFLIINDLKKRGNENTSPTPVNRSLRDINNNKTPILIPIQILEHGTQKSSNSNGNTKSVNTDKVNSTLVMNKESKFKDVTSSKLKNGKGFKLGK